MRKQLCFVAAAVSRIFFTSFLLKQTKKNFNISIYFLQEMHLSESKENGENLKLELDKIQEQLQHHNEEKTDRMTKIDRLKVQLDEKQHDLQMAQRNVQELTSMLQETSNKTESEQLERLQHLASIQELQSSQAQLVRERDAAKLRASERDREMTGLRKEVNSVIDKKKRLEQELQRLKQHLVTVEETYTQEAVESEERERSLRTKLAQCEDQLRTANVHQSTASKDAKAQLESLETKVAELTRECEQAKNKNFSLESEQAAHQRAMDNLNMALEGFQHEKTNDLKKAELQFEQK